MSNFYRVAFRSSLKGFIGATFALVVGLAAPIAEAQLPGVISFGAREQVQGYPAGTYKFGHICRDAAGDIFFMSSTGPAVYEIPANGPVQVVVPSTDASMTATGLNAIAVDPAGNIYLGATQKIYEVARNANGTYGSSVQIATGLLALPGGYYQSNDMAVDSSHNIYLVIPAQGSGNGAGIVTINSSAANTVGTGARYIFGSASTAATPIPVSVAVDTAGDLFYADGTNAWEYPVAQLQSSSTLTATQIGSTTSGNCTGCTALTSPKYISLDAANNLYVGNTASIFIVYNSGSFSSTSPTFLLSSTYTKSTNFFAFDNNGNLYANYSGSVEFYGAAKDFIQPVAGITVGTPITVGSVSSTTYAVQTLIFYFTQGVTLGATPVVVAGGASANGVAGAAQATLNSGTSCTANLVVAAGGLCYVELGYNIHDPGAAPDSVTLYSSTGSILATANVVSIGTGAALTFDGGVSTAVGSGYLSPAGIAVDNTGAAYVADPASNSVYKYAAGGGTAAGTAISPSSATVTGFSEPSGVALDPAGNLYIADTAHDRIVVIPTSTSGLVPASASVLTTTGYSLSSPHGVASDSFGNIFISDTGAGRVLEVPNPFSNAIGATPTVVASGMTSPYGIAFDAYNDLIIADNGANTVYEVPTALLTTSVTANVGSGTLTAVGTGFNAPSGVAADASGSVYVADTGNKRIVKVPSISGVLTSASQTVLVSNLDKPYGIATDLTADLYFTDSAAPSLSFIKRSAGSGSNATTVALGTVATGSTGSTTGVITNSGLTTSLTFGATPISTPTAPFSLGTDTCSTSTPLTPGSSCTVGINYSPTTTGNSTGGFTINDNALAVTTATQLISLTGDATGAVSTITLSGPSSIVYGDTAVYTVTARDASNNVVTMPVGTAYTLTITGGAGSSSPYSGTYNSTGTFILPTLGYSATPYSLTVTVNSITSSPAVSVTVAKAPLYLTANNFSRIFDVPNPSFTTTYSGFANGDTSSVVSGTGPTIATSATRISPYGNYAITLTGGSLTATNYTVTLVNGVLAVTGSAPQSIFFPPLPSLTHGTTVTLTGQSTSGLPVTYAVSGGSIAGNILTIGAAGTVTITANQAGNSSYAAAIPVTRTFTAQ